MIGAISDAKINCYLPQILESKQETFTNKRLLMYMSIMNGNCVKNNALDFDDLYW